MRGVSPRMLLRELIRETPQFGCRQHGVVDRDAIHFRAFDLAVIAVGVNGFEGDVIMAFSSWPVMVDSWCGWAGSVMLGYSVQVAKL